jgi:uncharacterized protein YijF (DUF1287 family)
MPAVTACFFVTSVGIAERLLPQIAREYLPGDIVTWKLPANLDHIAMVSNSKINSSGRYVVIQAIGKGAKIEDLLFTYQITGHYRYFRTNQ